MSRRLAGNVIKLEVYFGADRQTIMIRRNQDLIVRDVMEEIEKSIGIPLEEQVIFHKGNNLNEHMNVTLEQLGIENNHPIRINRDPDLPKRSPRQNRPINNGMGPQFPQQQQMMNGYPQQQQMMNMNNQAPQVFQHNLDPKSYLKEIQPGRVPDPTPYQVQLYKYNNLLSLIQFNLFRLSISLLLFRLVNHYRMRRVSCKNLRDLKTYSN